MFEQPTLTNVTIDLGTVPSAISAMHNETTAFVNGTADGLICMIPPSTSFVGWPYGGGGVNSGDEQSGGSGSPTTGGGSAGSSAATTRSDSAARQVGPSFAVGLGGVVVILAVGAGALAI